MKSILILIALIQTSILMANPFFGFALATHQNKTESEDKRPVETQEETAQKLKHCLEREKETQSVETNTVVSGNYRALSDCLEGLKRQCEGHISNMVHTIDGSYNPSRIHCSADCVGKLK